MVKYKMRYSKLMLTMSVVLILAIIAVLVYFYIVSGGSFFPAWLTILGISIGLLVLLSIPRYVILSPQSIEIHCVLELTTIRYDDIVKIRTLTNDEMRFSVPFCGIFGLFGYYGYYINLKKMRTFRLYSRKWDNFVMVHDKFDNCFVFGVENSDELVKRVQSMNTTINRRK